jgi:hypothetical protein
VFVLPLPVRGLKCPFHFALSIFFVSSLFRGCKGTTFFENNNSIAKKIQGTRIKIW